MTEFVWTESMKKRVRHIVENLVLDDIDRLNIVLQSDTKSDAGKIRQFSDISGMTIDNKDLIMLTRVFTIRLEVVKKTCKPAYKTKALQKRRERARQSMSGTASVPERPDYLRYANSHTQH